jgi:Leucine-rich repeat (LRR) protein
MANLRQLLIASNNLSELSPKAFMGLNSLEYLCLDNNNLATSVLENFQDLEKLRRLDWNIE